MARSQAEDQAAATHPLNAVVHTPAQAEKHHIAATFPTLVG